MNEAERHETNAAPLGEGKPWVGAVCGLLVLQLCLQASDAALAATKKEMGPQEILTAIGATLGWVVVLSSLVLTFATAKLVFRVAPGALWVTRIGWALLVAAGLDALDFVNRATVDLEVMPAYNELALSAILGSAFVAVSHRALGRPREAALAWGLTGAVVLLDTPLTGIILRATGDVLAWTPLLLLRGPVHLGMLALLWRLRRGPVPTTMARGTEVGSLVAS